MDGYIRRSHRPVRLRLDCFGLSRCPVHGRTLVYALPSFRLTSANASRTIPNRPPAKCRLIVALVLVHVNRVRRSGRFIRPSPREDCEINLAGSGGAFFQTDGSGLNLVEIPPRKGIECHDTLERFTGGPKMHPIADVAATLGSRFNIIFDPHDLTAYLNVNGGFKETALDIAVGVRDAEGRSRCLPFTSRSQTFEYVEYEATATTLTYRGISPKLGLELEMKVLCPFYPRDAKLSTAPCYLVSVRLAKRDKFRWEKPESETDNAVLFFHLGGEELDFKMGQAQSKRQPTAQQDLNYSFLSHFSKPGVQVKPAPETRTLKVSHCIRTLTGEARRVENGFELEVDFSENSSAGLELAWCGWIGKPVLNVHGKSCKLKSTSFFKSCNDVLDWAVSERSAIQESCRLLDSAFTDWSLGRDASNMTALALHSFLACSYWCVRPGGRDWFSVLEGSCYYHSTVDVEYNNAMLYVALWPELLDMLLDEWTEFILPGDPVLGAEDGKTGYLCHDMGAYWNVGKQEYPHHMPVEENVNYLLLLGIRYALGAPDKWVRQKLPTCRLLAEFVVQCDTTGNGFPDKGTANTIDDASPAVQFGREQVYLAVKAQAALWALAEIEERIGGGKEYAQRWKAFVAKSVETLDKSAWRDGHYVTALDAGTEGLINPWSEEAVSPGELEGWDAYSIYSANGLLYLWLGGFKMPRWRMERFRSDAQAACEATMTSYGCRHSSAGDSTVWFSQNIWRDMTAAYLDVDMLHNIERYWEYQLMTGFNYESSLYYDTTPGNNLNFYPRGAVVFGLSMAAAGLRMSRKDKEVSFNPVRPSLLVPLLPFADWAKGEIPWLRVIKIGTSMVAQITEPHLLDSYKKHIEGEAELASL